MGNKTYQPINRPLVPDRVIDCFHRLASIYRDQWYMNKDDYEKGCQELNIDIETSHSEFSLEMFSRAYLGSRAVQVFGNPDLRQMILAHNIPHSNFAARYGNLAFFLTFQYWTPTNQTLCTAAKYGQLTLVKYLHQERNIQDPTAIIDAIRNGQVEVVKYLIDKEMYNKTQLYLAFHLSPETVVSYTQQMVKKRDVCKKLRMTYISPYSNLDLQETFKYVPSKEIVELISKSTLDPMKRSFYIRNCIMKHPMVIEALIQKSSLMIPIISDLPIVKNIGQTIQSIKRLEMIGIRIFDIGESISDVVCAYMSSVLSGELFEWILVNKIQTQKTCNYNSFLDKVYETTTSPDVINILLEHGYRPKILPRLFHDMNYEKFLECIDIHGMLLRQSIKIDELSILLEYIQHSNLKSTDQEIIKRIHLLEQYINIDQSDRVFPRNP